MDPDLVEARNGVLLSATPPPSSRLIRVLAAALLCSLPLLSVYGFVHFFLKATLDDYFPSGGDPVGYWHEIATFAAVGFKGGYYGFEETTSRAATLGIGTFGAHSQWFQMFYGVIAKFTGWKPGTVVFVNIWLLTLSLGLMCWLMRGGLRFLLFCMALLATSPYIQQSFPVMMMEPLQYSIAFILAGLFSRRLATPLDSRRGLNACIWGVLLLAGLSRYSWGILYFAYYLDFSNKYPARDRLAQAAMATACLALTYGVYTYFTAPYPYEPFPGSQFGISVYVSLLHGDVTPLANLLKTNLMGVLRPEELSPPILLLWMIAFYTFASPWLALREKNDDVPAAGNAATCLAWFHAINLGGIMAAAFLYYYATVGMVGLRTSMPHFVCSLILLARYCRLRWLFPVIALQLVLMPAFLLNTLRLNTDEFDGYTKLVIQRETQDLFQKMQYRQGAVSPWCNTALVFGTYQSGAACMFVPAGISINDMRMPEKKDSLGSLKSAWVITREPDARALLRGMPGLQELGSQGPWTLYRNNNAPCEPIKDNAKPQ